MKSLSDLGEAYFRLEESLPPRKAATETSFRADPRSLRQWLDSLPMANLQASGAEMLDGVRRLNHLRIDPLPRLQALETLRPVLLTLAEAAAQQVSGSSFPLTGAKAGFADFALDIQEEFALGYRLVLVDVCAPSGNVGLLRGKSAALAALRALQHGKAQLAVAYLLYRVPPYDAWRALHEVHRFASEARLVDRQVEGISARAIYVESLLVALMNPYRQTQAEQNEAAAFARVLAPHAELSELRGDHDVPVQTGGDHGPGYVAEERVGTVPGAPFLRLERVLEYVDGQIARAGDGARTVGFLLRGGTAFVLDGALARAFAADLAARMPRDQARLGGGYRLQSVLGLHDLHYVLAGERGLERFMAQSLGEDAEEARATRAALRLPVRVIDQGLGGYRLMWDRSGMLGSHVRIGELVGLAMPGEPESQDWLVGQVRWFRVDELGAVQAGVELLARRSLPAAIRVPAARNGRMALRGVLLAPLNAGVEAGYDTLLASLELSRQADAVDVVLPEDECGPPAPARSVRLPALRFESETVACRRFGLPAKANGADAEVDAAAAE